MKRITRIGAAGVLTLALTMGAGVGAAFADTNTNSDEVTSAVSQELTRAGLHTDYVGDSGASLLSTTEFPKAFDLRHYNGTVTYNAGDTKSTITGGINYVAEVKKQDPLGSCWAFSITSAAETSMLTALDKNDDGQMNGSIDYDKAASGKAGTLAKSASDLSERHLAYFAFAHPTTYGIYPKQAGEGKYLYSGSTDAFTMMNVGGSQMIGLSIYTSGHGPVPESVASYMSNEGWIMAYDINGSFSDSSSTYVEKYFLTYTDAKEFVEKTWTDANLKAYNDSHNTSYTRLSFTPRVAKIGTWAVDDSLQYGTVAELDTSCMIATDKNETTGKLNDTSMAQVKEELSEGHSLSISYHADQSVPGQVTKGKSYLNTDTWAQYTFEAESANHAVTIVGWDDNYAASNFYHTVYKEDGTTVDTEATKASTPAGNGAWIVRNSWGSNPNSNPLYVKNWGIDNTGYFYLSYYDKSLSNIESYEFDVSDEAQARSGYVSYQHDLAEMSQVQTSGASTVVKTSNVFDGPKTGENSVVIRDLGFLTGKPNTTTTLEVYVMNDSEDTATVLAQGNPTVTVTGGTQEDSGYHRIHLGNNAFTVAADQKFAVVQTTKRANGDYESTYEQASSRDYMDSLVKMQTELATAQGKTYNSTEDQYGVAVVNEGESFIYVDGKWTDWKTYSTKTINDANIASLTEYYTNEVADLEKKSQDPAYTSEQQEAFATQARIEKKYFVTNPPATAYSIDNFMIKAYGDEVSDSTVAFVSRLYANVLDRSAESAGLSFWVAKLKDGMAPAEAASGFFASDEYKAKGETSAQTVARIYRVMFNREADAGGAAFWQSYLDAGMSSRAVIAGFSGSDEYKAYFASCGLSTASIGVTEARDMNYGVTAFASRLYTKCLGRTYDIQGLNDQCAALLAGTPCCQIAVNFFCSPEFSAHGYSNSDIIDIAYQTILGRAADAEGKSYWMNRMAEGLSVEGLVKGFCQSDEFEAICQQYGLTSGMR